MESKSVPSERSLFIAAESRSHQAITVFLQKSVALALTLSRGQNHGAINYQRPPAEVAPAPSGAILIPSALLVVADLHLIFPYDPPAFVILFLCFLCHFAAISTVVCILRVDFSDRMGYIIFYAAKKPL